MSKLIKSHVECSILELVMGLDFTNIHTKNEQSKLILLFLKLHDELLFPIDKFVLRLSIYVWIKLPKMKVGRR